MLLKKDAPFTLIIWAKLAYMVSPVGEIEFWKTVPGFILTELDPVAYIAAEIAPLQLVKVELLIVNIDR